MLFAPWREEDAINGICETYQDRDEWERLAPMVQQTESEYEGVQENDIYPVFAPSDDAFSSHSEIFPMYDDNESQSSEIIPNYLPDEE